MIWIIASLVITVIAWIALGFSKGGWKVCKKQWASLLGLFVILGGVIATVPTGHTGILTTFGKVENTTLEAGMHTKFPWQEVVCMDNRTQKGEVEMTGFSKDIQEVLVKYSINYQINKKNAQNIYKSIGTDYYNTVMAPRIQETVKSVIANYNAEDLINSRDTLSVEITEILKETLSKHNIEVVSTSIEDLDFSDAFTTAVEEKAVANQAYLKAEKEQQQKTMEQQQAAERKKIEANANAEVAKIDAEADREVLQIQADAAEYAGQKDAAVNEALAKSLTDILIQYYEIQQWDGKLPETVIGGDGTVLPIIGNIGTVEGETEAEEETTAAAE